MKNESGLHPLGCAVLVEPYEPEIKKSIIAMPPSVGDRASMMETRAVVVEIGGTAWEKESRPRAVVGDKVLISKLAGELVTGIKNGKQYRMVNDRDIFCRLEE